MSSANIPKESKANDSSNGNQNVPAVAKSSKKKTSKIMSNTVVHSLGKEGPPSNNQRFDRFREQTVRPAFDIGATPSMPPGGWPGMSNPPVRTGGGSSGSRSRPPFTDQPTQRAPDMSSARGVRREMRYVEKHIEKKVEKKDRQMMQPNKIFGELSQMGVRGVVAALASRFPEMLPKARGPDFLQIQTEPMCVQTSVTKQSVPAVAGQASGDTGNYYGFIAQGQGFTGPILIGATTSSSVAGGWATFTTVNDPLLAADPSTILYISFQRACMKIMNATAMQSDGAACIYGQCQYSAITAGLSFSTLLGYVTTEEVDDPFTGAVCFPWFSLNPNADFQTASTSSTPISTSTMQFFAFKSTSAQTIDAVLSRSHHIAPLESYQGVYDAETVHVDDRTYKEAYEHLFPKVPGQSSIVSKADDIPSQFWGAAKSLLGKAAKTLITPFLGGDLVEAISSGLEDLFGDVHLDRFMRGLLHLELGGDKIAQAVQKGVIPGDLATILFQLRAWKIRFRKGSVSYLPPGADNVPVADRLWGYGPIAPDPLDFGVKEEVVMRHRPRLLLAHEQSDDDDEMKFKSKTKMRGGSEYTVMSLDEEALVPKEVEPITLLSLATTCDWMAESTDSDH